MKYFDYDHEHCHGIWVLILVVNTWCFFWLVQKYQRWENENSHSIPARSRPSPCSRGTHTGQRWKQSLRWTSRWTEWTRAFHWSCSRSTENRLCGNLLEGRFKKSLLSLTWRLLSSHLQSVLLRHSWPSLSLQLKEISKTMKKCPEELWSPCFPEWQIVRTCSSGWSHNPSCCLSGRCWTLQLPFPPIGGNHYDDGVMLSTLSHVPHMLWRFPKSWNPYNVKSFLTDISLKSKNFKKQGGFIF